MENLNYWFEFNLNTFLWIFIILNVVNVVIQTIKTIVTVNGTPFAAAVINAVTFAIYTVVVVFMNADGLGVFWKAVIIGIVNFIGVYVVKLIEVKNRKDKLWKVEATVSREVALDLVRKLKANDLPYNYVDINKYYLFNVYCATQAQSAKVKEVLNFYNAKYFVSESKML
jgi:uncharacterized protein YebE (UPF0316 family)